MLLRQFSALKNHLLHDDLRRSSTLLIGAQVVNAGAAFLFWVLCARLFPAHEVGLATSFISYGILAAAFTHLGLPITTLRFLPTSKNRGGLFGASLLLVALCSVVGGLVALSAIGHLAPRLDFAHDSLLLSLLLVAIVVGTALGNLLDGVLASLKKAQYVLGKAVLTNAPRVVLPFAVLGLGVQGMVGVYAGMLGLGVVFAASVIIWKFLQRGSLRPQFSELFGHRSFAAANYFGGMFGVLPSTLTPIIVLNKLGAAQAAFFYMPMQLAIFLGIISNATCQALLAETAQEDNPQKHREHVLNAAGHLFRLLVPAAVGVALIGWLVLRVYGAAYAAHGYAPLLVLAAASLFVAVNWIGDTWLNIQKKSLAFFMMNACNALLVVGSVYLLAGHGLLGVACGWLIGQVLSAVIYVLVFMRDYLSLLVSRLRS